MDDGNLVQVGGKQYEANPFGLYCMHGNVAEWTRSDYLPYPYNEKSKESRRIRWFVAVLISSDRNSRRLIPVRILSVPTCVQRRLPGNY